MSTFVLVDRVWHDGCAWMEVRKRLQRHRQVCGGYTLFENPDGMADKLMAAGHG
jgi:hypothetical protein